MDQRGRQVVRIPQVPRADAQGPTIVNNSIPNVLFRAMDPLAYRQDMQFADVIKAGEYWSGLGPSWGVLPWAIWKPWKLQRTPFEWLNDNQIVYDGRRHTYDQHFRRYVETEGSDPSDGEWQVLNPPLLEGDIIPVTRVRLLPANVVHDRQGVTMQVHTSEVHSNYQHVTIDSRTGEGHGLPVPNRWYVLEISKNDGDKWVRAQVYELQAGATYYQEAWIEEDSTLQPDEPDGLVTVKIRWSWAYWWLTETAWAQEYNP